jgi:hypothetical protein
MNALTPVNLVAAVVTPESVADRTLADGIAGYRSALALGAVVAAGAGIAVVWGMRSAMQRTFMFTVRKLAGTA